MVNLFVLRTVLSSLRRHGVLVSWNAYLSGRNAPCEDVSFDPFDLMVILCYHRYLTIGFGYIMARLNLFPAAASRGASHITMNLALPCLVFANIVPGILITNMKS